MKQVLAPLLVTNSSMVRVDLFATPRNAALPLLRQHNPPYPRLLTVVAILVPKKYGILLPPTLMGALLVVDGSIGFKLLWVMMKQVPAPRLAMNSSMVRAGLFATPRNVDRILHSLQSLL